MWYLKLTCRHIILTAAIFFNVKYISLLPLLLMKCHAWFHLYGFTELWATGTDRNNSKWKCIPPPGIEPATPCFLVWRSNHSAIGTVNDKLLKLLHYYFLRYYQWTRVPVHVWDWFWLDVYWNWLSDKICISFTNIDVIYYFLQNFVWANTP